MTNFKWMLLVEDSVQDAELALRAMSANQIYQDVVVACDGAEALDCLYRRGAFHGRNTGNPAVVLLDLKMPKLDGLEVLYQIKIDPRLKSIPVVMFTSSREVADVMRSYQFGACAYVVKPVDFKRFISVVKELRKYWMEINEPPPAQPDKSTSSQTLFSAAA